MSFKGILAILFLVLFITTPGVAQEEKLTVNKDGQLKVTPEMIEKAKRRDERLRNPSFIKLTIEPESNCQGEDSKKVSDYYKAHGKIKVKVFMTNTSSELITISIPVGRSYNLYDLQLYRDGQLVPYRKDVTKITANPPSSVSHLSARLEPSKKEMVDMVYLDKWYRPLEPGHYQLDIKARFQPDGNWTDRASITFDVAPE